MNDHSLLAERLRAHRARHGRHGRMTQEELADLLGVSVDAVGKYERSVSFPRGDLEHRLTERLGWPRADVLACREDWQARQHRPGGTRYRLLDQAVVDAHFAGSWHDAGAVSIDFADAELPELPAELEASRDIYLPIFDVHPDHWGVVFAGPEVVASWVLLLLLPDDAQAFRNGHFLESVLSPERIHRPILPGRYYGYCPGLIIRPGHEAAAPLLLSSFVRFLEAFADRGIVLDGIGSVSVSPGGAQISRDLGMTHLGPHCLSPDYGVWELPGRAIPGSIFGRRSPLLRRVYGAEFPS